jgi:Condensation domain
VSTNPFDDDSGPVHALVNAEGRSCMVDLSIADRALVVRTLLEPTGGELVDIWPLAPRQESFFRGGYLRQEVVELREGADAAPLRRAALSLLDRYPQLRAGFVALPDGRVVQGVPRAVSLPWAAEDLENEDDLAALLVADRADGFDLARPPLLRAMFVRGPGGRRWLVLTFHPIVLDGRSLALVLDELLGGRPRSGGRAREAHQSCADRADVLPVAINSAAASERAPDLD